MYNTRILWFLAVNFLLLKKYLIMAPLTGSEDLQLNQYSSSMLHQLRPPFNMLSLSKSVRDEITDLGIKKRFGDRGPRGNKSRCKHTMEWKAKWDRNNQVHHHLLRSLPKQTIYDRNSRSKFGVVNTRSIRNKSNEFLHYCTTEDLDFCAVTETWLTSHDTLIINDLQSNNHSFYSIERMDGRGGGIGLLIKE